MKKNTLLTSTIFGLVIMMSSHTYAISGEGFKIVSESVKSSPGFNFKVQELTSKKKECEPKASKCRSKDQGPERLYK